MASELGVPGSGFQFHRIEAVNIGDVYNVLSSDALAADLADGKSGVCESELQDECAHCTWREIVALEVDVYKEGKVQRETLLQIKEAFFCFFKKFAITSGNARALQLGGFGITRGTGVELRSAHIAPTKLLTLTDHMTAIRGMDFDKIHHPVWRSARLNGQIESMADIAPFNAFTDNLKSVKGVLNTPEGVRTVKLTVDGKASITKKKDETLSEDFYIWLHRLVYSS